MLPRGPRFSNTIPPPSRGLGIPANRSPPSPTVSLHHSIEPPFATPMMGPTVYLWNGALVRKSSAVAVEQRKESRRSLLTLRPNQCPTAPVACHHRITLGTKIAMISNPLVDVTDHFDKLYQLADAPSTLVQKERSLHTWASTLRLVKGDEYEILPTLALAYSRVRKMSNNRSKEHTQHRSIGAIIESAFSAGLELQN